MKTQVLALNAFHGGSHRAFLDGWREHSRHEFTVLSLPGYKWKWRMRHAAATFAREAQQLLAQGMTWDVVFCTDMLNAAEWRGLAPEPLGRLPLVAYFHESQLNYPDRNAQPRDLHFAFTNLLTAAAADRVWFNSGYHQRKFVQASDAFLRRMPDFAPLYLIDEIAAKSEVQTPGLDLIPATAPRAPGPLRIAWVARWEHDKDPETFFAATYRLLDEDVPFRLSVFGESYGEVPECFAEARRKLAGHIDHWGYQADRPTYREALAKCDVVVSTARHEFFGIAVLEAVSAGCFPLVPQRLAYPETLGADPDFFYDGSMDELVEKLKQLARRVSRRPLWRDRSQPEALTQQYEWKQTAARLDAALENCAGIA